MRQFLVLSCVAVVLLVATTGAKAAALTASDPDTDADEIGVQKKYKHDKFFKSLNTNDKFWLLNLAVSHEAAKLNFLDGGSIKPVDEYSNIPEDLFEVMLNGDVTAKFQKDLVTWLRKKYGFTNQDFQTFDAAAQQICHNGKCWDMGDIGSECCPF